jgi:hypothetical protein
LASCPEGPMSMKALARCTIFSSIRLPFSILAVSRSQKQNLTLRPSHCILFVGSAFLSQVCCQSHRRCGETSIG